MHWDLILWLIALASNIALLILLIYQLICLSDLEADYLNPYETASNINSLVLPEFGLQAAFSALFLVTGHFLMFLVTLPVAIYHARLFTRAEHLVDVTEIFRALSVEKKHRLIKLCVYLLFFFLVIFRPHQGRLNYAAKRLGVNALLVIAIYNSLADEDEALHGFWVF